MHGLHAAWYPPGLCKSHAVVHDETGLTMDVRMAMLGDDVARLVFDS